MTRTVRGLAGVIVAALPLSTLACGYCVEDKIAAAYDHAVVTRALAQKHQIAFFAIEGNVQPDESTRRALEALAGSAHGVDRGSARVSAKSAALSVAFDPGRVPLGEVERALGRKLAAKSLSIQLLRTMDQPAALKSVGLR